MAYLLYVAADLYGQKTNLEIEFAGPPSLNELHAFVQSTFNYESALLMPPSAPQQQPVIVSKLQMYNESDGSWVDLTAGMIPNSHAQLYVFQADPSFQESQQPIPPPRRPSTTAPSIGRAASTVGGVLERTTPKSSFHVVPRDASNSSESMRLSPRRRNGNGSRTPSPSGSYRILPTTATSPAPLPPHHHAAASSFTTTTATGSPMTFGPTSPSRSNLAAAPVPEHPTQGEKIEYVFKEMDTNGDSRIQLHELRALCRAVAIGYSDSTVAEVFRRADKDGDGVLSPAEHDQFMTAYPTLLDAIFFRLRDVSEARAMEATIAEEKRALELAREQRQRCIALGVEASQLATEAMAKVRDAEQAQATNVARANGRKQAVTDSLADVEVHHRKRAAFDVELESARDRVSSAARSAEDAAAEERSAEERFVQRQGVVQQCREREAELQRLLAEARAETERQQQAALDAQTEWRRRKEHGGSTHARLTEAKRELEAIGDLFTAAERDLRFREERRRGVEEALQTSTKEVEASTAALELARRDAQVCADRESTNRALCDESDETVAASERRLATREQQLAVFNQKRSENEQREVPLIQKEIKLRAHRDALDEEESQLRRDASSFYDLSRSGPAGQTPVAGGVLRTAASGGNLSPRRQSSSFSAASGGGMIR